ncbi:MAG TPA: hypothetical protein VGB67_10255 [Fibrella sp.]|jgi:hypothetical protein
MEHYSFDKLLRAVNNVAMEASHETLRESVTANLVHVYRKIGASGLFHPGIMVVQPTEDDFVDLPPTMIKLIDVKTGTPELYGRGISGVMNRFGQIVVGQRFTRFEEMENRLYFHDGPLRQPITVTYWELPTDREGAPKIDSRVYKAAELYCQSEVARVNLHFMNKQSFSATPYQVDKQEANREMDAARGEVNELKETDFVELYNNLHPLGYTDNFVGAYGGRGYSNYGNIAP